MMIDLYTKAVLTTIAAVLVVIALQGAFPTAQAQISEACGNAKNPCWVTAALPFYVESAPKRPVYVQVSPREPLYIATPPLGPIEVKISR
jgi:hypothetical protein